MYSLPITTYSDYWRATKVWTAYIGGLAMFVAGTRYSALEAPEVTQTLQQSIQLTTQPLNTKSLSHQVVLLDSPKWATSLGMVRQDEIGQVANVRNSIIQGAIKRGVFSQGSVSRGLTNQDEAAGQKELVQEEPSKKVELQEVQNIESVSKEIKSEGVGDRITSRIQVDEKEIPFETQYVETDKLLPGTREVQEKGEKGILRQIIKTFEVEGQPVDQQVQASIELKSPKKEVILQNSKPVPKKKVVIQNLKPALHEEFVLDQANISKTITVESTAYTFTGNKTATGVDPREGIIAVDPKVIAMGSRVYVEGYGYAIAADTGGDIRGNRIDVFFSTLRQCIDWGRKPVHIYVLNAI